MRVTQTMMSNTLLRDLNGSFKRLSRLEEMMSTQKNFSKPSDDPVGTVQSLFYRKRLAEIEQYNKNANSAISWYEQTDTALSEGINALHTIMDKVRQAANDTLGPEEREKIAEEIKQLRDQLGSIANTTLDNRYIFGGTDTSTPPFRAGDSTDPEEKYRNTNQNELKLEVSSSISMPVNLNGIGLFGVHTASDGTTSLDLFKDLKDIIGDLEGGTVPSQAISQRLGGLQKHLESFLHAQGKVGAMTNRVELLQARLQSQNQITEESLSNVEDVDTPKLIIEMNLAKNTHDAALSVGAKIIQQTLVDFIR